MATFIVETSKEYFRVEADCAGEAKSYIQHLVSLGEVKGEVTDAWEMTELYLDDEVEED